jgi:hypothetical protein
MTPVQKTDETYGRMEKGDVKDRFVIDSASPCGPWRQLGFSVSEKEGVDGHEFVEAFCDVITDIRRNSCVDKRDG